MNNIFILHAYSVHVGWPKITDGRPPWANPSNKKRYKRKTNKKRIVSARDKKRRENKK